MGVAVEQVDATLIETAPAEPSESAAPASGFDPEKIRAQLRRDEQRRLRLTVD